MVWRTDFSPENGLLQRNTPNAPTTKYHHNMINRNTRQIYFPQEKSVSIKMNIKIRISRDVDKYVDLAFSLQWFRETWLQPQIIYFFKNQETYFGKKKKKMVVKLMIVIKWKSVLFII